MKLLLDTHALLWLTQGDERFSVQAEAAVLDTHNALYLSAASYWEICIKYALGKLGLQSNWPSLLDQELAVNQIKWLPIEKEHCQALTALPLVHGDPFDRLLIAQARVEGMTLLTADEQIRRYEVPTLW